MGDLLIIDDGLFETRAALLRDNKVIDLQIERQESLSEVGDFYYGRVSKIQHELNAAFVELGPGKYGFLQAQDMTRKGIPIAQATHEGQRLLVQVTKDPLGDKTVQLTCHFSLKSANLIYRPNSQKIVFAKKIKNKADRLKILEIMDPETDDGGFTIRSSAPQAGRLRLVEEKNYLMSEWLKVQQMMTSSRNPVQVSTKKSTISIILENYLSNELKILVNTAKALKLGEEFLTQASPSSVSDITLWPHRNSLFEEYGAEEEIEKATQDHIKLDSGVSLSFEQTEALLVVDVNSSSLTSSHGVKNFALTCNIEAAEEIARQLRLRNSSGIIIVDFIQMNGKGDVQKLSGRLQERFAKDPVPTQLIGMTELGLMQITRRRTRTPLLRALYMPCSFCAGSGHHPDLVTTLSKLVRDLETRLISRDARTIKISAGKALAQPLNLHKRMIENHLSRPLEIFHDNRLPEYGYELD
jgi:ribonuclease G